MSKNERGHFTVIVPYNGGILISYSTQWRQNVSVKTATRNTGKYMKININTVKL